MGTMLFLLDKQHAKSWGKLYTKAEEWRQTRYLNRHSEQKLAAEKSHSSSPPAVKLRSIHEKLVLDLGSVVRESCWTEESDSPEERARWAAIQKEMEERVATWLKDFLSAIRHLELALMFDEAATVNKAVTALPMAKQVLFSNIGKMQKELKRKDS